MQLQIFTYEDGGQYDFTAIEIDGEPWFVAADVCSLLDIRNVSDAVNSLDEDEKTTSLIPRGSRNVVANLVNESGLSFLYWLHFMPILPSTKSY